MILRSPCYTAGLDFVRRRLAAVPSGGRAVDLAATIYRALGVDLSTKVLDCPLALCTGEPIAPIYKAEAI